METLETILLYHVVDGEVFSSDLSDGLVVETYAMDGDDLTVSKTGEGVMVNDAKVVVADIAASNGIIHVIDKVLIPSNIFIPTLFDVGSSDAAFSTLVAAVTRAELVDALSAPGELTVFAPNNDGFDMLPAGTVQTLTEDEDKSPLTDILKYHIVPEFITPEEIFDGRTSATTLQGAELTFSVTDDGESFTVNGIRVLGSAPAGNGIGYVIDEVLLQPVVLAATSPPSPAPTKVPTKAPTKAPTSMEEDGALATSTFVATLVSAVALLMV